MSPFHFTFRSVLNPHHHHHHHHRHVSHRTFVDTTINWVRDRGLDHVVERERNLRPIINIKNLIKSEPSKSLPISILTKSRHSLMIPTRPVEFVRQYPSIFEEFLPAGIAAVQPHVRLTPQVLDIDANEQLMYQSVTYTHQAADRLFKLLMLVRSNKLPLNVIELFKWDLGLPQDYVDTIVPEFPDYFKTVVGKYGQPELEMVCWSDELATSVMEKKAKQGYVKGMPLAFPMRFSRGFEMDKKLKKWIDEWQKLPYVSPYENAAHLSSQSDESDKWAVAVLHELLHILVPKKTDRENVLALGEYLGIRSRFKRALLHHPGILYVSSKIRTYTVVLREGYKRGAIIENHPLMDIRNQYIHLMNAVKEDGKTISSKEKKKKKGIEDSKGEDVEEEDDDNEEELEGELCDSSDAEVEHDNVDSEDDEEEDEDDDEEESMTSIRMNDANTRGRRARKSNFDVMTPSRNAGRGSSGQRRAWKSDNTERRRSGGQYPLRSGDEVSAETSRRTQADVRRNVHQNSRERSNRSRSRGSYSPDKKNYVGMMCPRRKPASPKCDEEDYWRIYELAKTSSPMVVRTDCDMSCRGFTV